jgi:hypothetical protein
MSNPTTRTPEGDAAFFAALENGCSVRAACEAADYARRCVYRWRAEHDDFAKSWAEALVIAADLFEAEADRRGRDGYDEPYFFQGEIKGAKRKYSDALLLARLRALKPEVYRERHALRGGTQNVTVIIRDFDAAPRVITAEAQRVLPHPREDG